MKFAKLVTRDAHVFEALSHKVTVDVEISHHGGHAATLQELVRKGALARVRFVEAL